MPAVEEGCVSGGSVFEGKGWGTARCLGHSESLVGGTERDPWQAESSGKQK